MFPFAYHKFHAVAMQEEKLSRCAFLCLPHHSPPTLLIPKPVHIPPLYFLNESRSAQATQSSSSATSIVLFPPSPHILFCFHPFPYDNSGRGRSSHLPHRREGLRSPVRSRICDRTGSCPVRKFNGVGVESCPDGYGYYDWLLQGDRRLQPTVHGNEMVPSPGCNMFAITKSIIFTAFTNIPYPYGVEVRKHRKCSLKISRRDSSNFEYLQSLPAELKTSGESPTPSSDQTVETLFRSNARNLQLTSMMTMPKKSTVMTLVPEWKSNVSRLTCT